MSATSALVTGASGFIGSHLVARLLSEGSRVAVLARSSSALPANWRDRVRVISCDDFGESNLRRLLDTPVETVFHLAAYGVKPNQRDVDEIVRINMEMPTALARLSGDWTRAHGDDRAPFRSIAIQRLRICSWRIRLWNKASSTARRRQLAV